MKIRAIITGSTGMVGEGVMHECLQHPDVEKVLVINRKPGEYSHPKLTELIQTDFFNLDAVEPHLKGYNACFFCLGVSAIGMKVEDYYRTTYQLTMAMATTLARLHPDMTFCYVSGAGTDSTEKGRSMWARVKGKTENDLMKLPFRQVYMFRPGFIQPTKGLKNTLKWYKYMGWLFPVLQRFFSGYVSTLQQIGIAMINAVSKGYSKSILEVTDIITLSKK
jgi:uncharacterized protein YbjT (DUF2867 family)